jgi:hypothetical protein
MNIHKYWETTHKILSPQRPGTRDLCTPDIKYGQKGEAERICFLLHKGRLTKQMATLYSPLNKNKHYETAQ